MKNIEVRFLNGKEQTLDGDALQELQHNLHGPILFPGNGEYESARTIWNGMHENHPAFIVECSGPADVLDTVNFARKHNLLISVKGGGHNVAGTAICDKGIVIDLSRLRNVRVDPKNRIADVGGGALISDIDRETQLFGLVLPSGLVSETGIAGLTLGGGYGWVRRKHGLAIDSLISVDIVTGNGEFVTASENENQDLFWAVRGGGGNFGVVTSFRFRLHPLGPMIYFAAPMYPAEKAGEILPKWRDFCENASEDVTSYCIFQTLPVADAFPREVWNKEVIVTPTMYAGNPEEGENVLKPLREMGDTVLDLSSPMPYRALQQAFDWVFPNGQRYYWKTTTLPKLDDKAISTIVDIGTSRSSPGTLIGVWQLGGAMARVPEDATGYGRRDDPWLVNIDSGWSDPAEDDKHISFTRDAWNRLMELSDGGMYLHYGDLEKDELIRRAYGKNYSRLVEVKTKYDPMNLFRINQNIKPKQ
jgi:FAD/FMN-containing dehydrogenase